MNDDPSASTSNPPRDGPDDEETLEAEEGTSSADRHERQRMRNRTQDKKRGEFLDEMLWDFDVLIYCELFIVYYMDCSLLRFLLRAIVQFFYLTPKPIYFPEPPKNRPYVGAILGTNLTCALLHIFLARPEAGEATRGYLHGGMIIDFVGQEGPISKFRLVIIDLLALTVQLFMLAAHFERQRLKATSTTSSSSTPTSAAVGEAASPMQDHDSEERGIFRTEASTADNIELQPLASSRQDREFRGRDANLKEHVNGGTLAHMQDGSGEGPENHPLDVFFTGEVVVADLHVLDTVRHQWWLRGIGGSDVTGSSSSNMAANLTGGRLGIRVRVGGRDFARL
ncbi:MAG: hypothetical protein M1827_004664 [Pycnora praestabilis]|nr:MAG: hypothetical protein M1827_004664 [Pycnora praestabilis]